MEKQAVYSVDFPKACMIDRTSLFVVIIVAQSCYHVVIVLVVEQCCNDIVFMAEQPCAAQPC